MKRDALFANLSICLRRLPRHPCVLCGKRRVLFQLILFPDERLGDALCAVCAGLR